MSPPIDCGVEIKPELFIFCSGCLVKDRDRYKELFELAMNEVDRYRCSSALCNKLDEEEISNKDLISEGLARIEIDINEEIIKIAKDNGVDIVMKKNVKTPDASTIYRCKFKPTD